MAFFPLHDTVVLVVRNVDGRILESWRDFQKPNATCKNLPVFVECLVNIVMTCISFTIIQIHICLVSTSTLYPWPTPPWREALQDAAADLSLWLTKMAEKNPPHKRSFSQSKNELHTKKRRWFWGFCGFSGENFCWATTREPLPLPPATVTAEWDPGSHLGGWSILDSNQIWWLKTVVLRWLNWSMIYMFYRDTTTKLLNLLCKYV